MHGIPQEALVLLTILVLLVASVLGVPLAVVAVVAHRRGNRGLELLVGAAWVAVLTVGLAAWDGVGLGGTVAWRLVTYGGALSGGALASRAVIRDRRLSALRDNAAVLIGIAVATFACSSMVLFVLLVLLFA